jgi:hypothetical protein
MHDKKLLIILKTLKPKELKRFKAFVESPYFNTNKNLCLLLDYIQKYYPQFEHPQCSEANAFKHLFPNTPYRDEVITKLLNKLFDLLRAFIAQQDLDEDNAHTAQPDTLYCLKETLNLADFYIKRSPKHAPSALEKAAQYQSQLPHRDMEYYYYDFKLATLRSAYLSNMHDKSESGLTEALQKSAIYYYLNQLYFTCLYVNQRRIANLDINLQGIDELLNKISQQPHYLQLPAIAIWYECLQLLTQTDKKSHYLQIKNYLNQHNHLFNQEDTRIIYTFLENNAKKISHTDQEFYSELFELYDTQLKQGAIQLFQPSLFKNIVVVALRLERFEWIKQFMTQSHDIVLQYRDAVHQYIDVHLLFKEQKFEAALIALSQANYGIDLFFKLDARRMYLKIFYELQYELAFHDLINSFRKFLSDHKNLIAEYHLQANRNFIHFIARLYALAHNDRVGKRKLNVEIAELSAQQLPEKDWLWQKTKA